MTGGHVTGERRDLDGSGAKRPSVLVSREGDRHIDSAVMMLIVGRLVAAGAIRCAGLWPAVSAEVVANLSKRHDLIDGDDDVRLLLVGCRVRRVVGQKQR